MHRKGFQDALIHGYAVSRLHVVENRIESVFCTFFFCIFYLYILSFPSVLFTSFIAMGDYDLGKSVGSHATVTFCRAKEDALLMCAPPCSLFVGACASVHRRTWRNPYGNIQVFKVRLANRIWANMVPCLLR